MGFFRDLSIGVAQATLDALQKAPAKPQDEEDDEDTPPGKPAGKKPPGASAEAPDDDADADDDANPGPAEAPEEVDGEVVKPGAMQASNADGVPTPGKTRSLPELEGAMNDPKSLFWDPFAIVDALGYKDRPSPITYSTLNAMVWKMPVVQAIIQTRVKQVANFSRVQQDRFSTGFRIVQRDKKAKPTPASEQRSQQLERWLLHTGQTDNPAGRDSFSSFLQKITRDSLTYDQMCVEIVPTRAGPPAEFYAVDASTIRIADTTRLYVDSEDKKVVRYVQIYDGLVVAEYTSEEMVFGVRNPATNIRLQQYGQSEMEMLVTTVTALLWAWEFNMKQFSQGTSVKGIINFKGAIPEKQLRMFRRHWYSTTSGLDNAFKTPITNADDMQWINMQMSNRDMEFNAWMDFLIKITAAVYGIDPIEINFKYGDGGGAKAMFESSGQQKLTASKDKGLKPLLEFLEHHINQSLIMPLDEEFRFEFVGYDSDTKGEEADLNTKLVKTVKTVNELRAMNDDPPLPDGDIILDPVYQQASSQRQMQEQQKQQAEQMQQQQEEGGGEEGGGQEGDEGDEGGPPGLAQPPGGLPLPIGNKPPPPQFAEKSMKKHRTVLRKGVSGKSIIVDIEV